MNLENIHPNFKDNYLKFHNKHVSCGPCRNATLKMNVNTCQLDENGSPLPNCKQKGRVTSSFGNPIVFTNAITLDGISNFFCINLDKT